MNKTILTVIAALTFNAGVASAYDWLQFGFSQDKNANNTLESTLTLANVSQLQQIFKVSIPSAPESAPVLLTGVSTSSGIRDLVFCSGERADLLAFDAHTGTKIWAVNY